MFSSFVNSSHKQSKILSYFVRLILALIFTGYVKVQYFMTSVKLRVAFALDFFLVASLSTTFLEGCKRTSLL